MAVPEESFGPTDVIYIPNVYTEEKTVYFMVAAALQVDMRKFLLSVDLLLPMAHLRFVLEQVVRSVNLHCPDLPCDGNLPISWSSISCRTLPISDT